MFSSHPSWVPRYHERGSYRIDCWWIVVDAFPALRFAFDLKTYNVRGFGSPVSVAYSDFAPRTNQ